MSKVKIKTKYKYIEFVPTVLVDMWNCINRKSKSELGTVDWDKQEHRYVFEPANMPESALIFSADCLQDIAHFIKQLKD